MTAERTLTERLEACYTGVVHDVMRAMGLADFTLPPGLRPILPERAMAGPAFTILGKVDPSADPHETLLVLDGTTGQNALQQAKLFGEKSGVTGLVLTKLDGTAKGGIVIAIRNELKLPVKFVGLGEKMDDLQEFDADQFVHALFSGMAGTEEKEDDNPQE